METFESRQLISADVLTWHNNLSRDGANLNETILSPANVNKTTFGKKLSLRVDGAIYAQPLYVSGLNVNGTYGKWPVAYCPLFTRASVRRRRLQSRFAPSRRASPST